MDDYGGDIDDAAFAAVADAAERQHRGQASTSAAGATAGGNSISAAAGGAAAGTAEAPKKIVQPVPRKLPRPAGSGSIIVSIRQKGNPLLPYIKSVPWEYGDISPDYLPTPTTAILYLSLKYHRLHPEYIYTRIKLLGGNSTFSLRVVLVQVDTDQHAEPIKELTKTSIINNLTVILCWSAAEAGKYVESYKVLEKAGTKLIKERRAEDYVSRVEDFATSVKGVNRTDALGLITMFGSVRAAVNASEGQLNLIPGWGEKKVQRWGSVVNENFRVGGALGKKRREEEERRRLEKEGGEKVGAERVMTNKERAALGRRMGLAVQADIKVQEDDEMAFDADEEEALLALEEEEMARRRKVPEVGPILVPTIQPAAGGDTPMQGTEDGVMAALARLRK